MDPYLEHPALWPGVHQSVITYSRDLLQEQAGDGFIVTMGERVYVERPEEDSFYPDVSLVQARRARKKPKVTKTKAADSPVVVVVLEGIERREVFLEILDARNGDKVVTVIEVLSPSNKRKGPGRELYLGKQRDVLESDASLVEIDLLREGEPTVALPPESLGEEAYRVVVSRPQDRKRRELYPIALRDPLPRAGIPLVPPHADLVLDLAAVMAQTYERGAYGRRIDYGREPFPALRREDEAWCRKLLAKR
jgi:Protein of unknown function (DUF4058)